MNPAQPAPVLGHSGLRMIEEVYAHLNAADGYEAALRMLTSERVDDERSRLERADASGAVNSYPQQST